MAELKRDPSARGLPISGVLWLQRVLRSIPCIGLLVSPYHDLGLT